MAALQYVSESHYAALLLRRTYPELTQEGGLIDLSHHWLDDTDAEWSEHKKRWTFPSGATLQFGHMEHESDRERYQGSSFHFIGFDELTQFTQRQYQFMFRSLRKDEWDKLPLRMRSTGNPGGVGHEWVRQRFVEGDVLFIPSTWRENPYLNRDEYEKSLNRLDPITRQQLKEGDWYTNPEGGLFKRSWFEIKDIPPKIMRRVRFWDLASTKPTNSTDPDYTVGLLLGLDESHDVWILDVIRLRGTPLEVEKTILQAANLDGVDTMIAIEQEGGASGKIVIDYYRKLLAGYQFIASIPHRSKIERAKPVSSYAEAGKIKLLKGNWISAFLDELEAFPMEGYHDDQVDALSGAFNLLFHSRERKKRRIFVAGPRG